MVHTYQSSGSAAPAAVAGGATYTNEIDTERDRDIRAINIQPPPHPPTHPPTYSVVHTYASSGSAAPAAVAGGATYTNEIDTEHDRDTRAMLEMNIRAMQEDGGGDVDEHGNKIYRGQAMYRNYVPKNEAQIGGNKYTGTQVNHPPTHPPTHPPI